MAADEIKNKINRKLIPTNTTGAGPAKYTKFLVQKGLLDLYLPSAIIFAPHVTVSDLQQTVSSNHVWNPI